MSAGSAGFVERALAYGALSYGFGFLVVMLHTARLGFPVIALLEPIYIWIGLPLAAVAFFGTQLTAQMRKDSLKARDELASAVQNLPTQSDKPLGVAMFELGRAFSSAFPVLPFHLTEHLYRPLFRWMARLAAKHGAVAEAKKAAAYASRVLMGLSGVERILNVLSYLALLALALWIYVWQLYPIIPKAYGGGAPITVRLVLSRDAFPTPFLADLGVTSLASEPGAPQGVQTDTLILLYSTTDAFYVRTHSARTVAFASGAVHAIIWP